MDLIGYEEISRMTGLNHWEVWALFKEPDCPYWTYKAIERNTFISWWTRRCLKRKEIIRKVEERKENSNGKRTD